MSKKTLLIAMGLAASGFATAGSMGPVCTPGNVTVSCDASQWSLGLQALYLNPTESGSRSYIATTPTQFVPVQNDWNWGYNAEGSYQFNSGNDITVNWMHIGTNSQQLGVFAAGITTPPLAPLIFNNQLRFDKVDVGMGQKIAFSSVNSMHLFGGLRYTNIQANATSYIAAPGIVGRVPFSSLSFFNNSDFKGVGPVGGVGYSYNVSNEFSLKASTAAALLSGTTRLSTGANLQPTNLEVGTVYASKKTIVSSFDAKLGLNYDYAMA
jgi:hypothetical protein